VGRAPGLKVARVIAVSTEEQPPVGALVLGREQVDDRRDRRHLVDRRTADRWAAADRYTDRN
jgi:hypothetical protein